ncbi:hypothetical protein HK405_005407 [Cladochytrium tenue]|nr:hypothetical protein HK405_005407 [Cladochytrium tenue]
MFEDIEVDCEYALAAAHTALPLWAAARLDGQVDVYSDASVAQSGSPAPKSSFRMQHESAAPVVMAFHPSRRLLALAWISGA